MAAIAPRRTQCDDGAAIHAWGVVGLCIHNIIIITTHQRETTPMFTKIAIALALAFAPGSITGALAATTKKPKVTQGQSLYDLHRQVRRDTATHDFRSRKTKTKKPAGQ